MVSNLSIPEGIFEANFRVDFFSKKFTGIFLYKFFLQGFPLFFWDKIYSDFSLEKICKEISL